MEPTQIMAERNRELLKVLILMLISTNRLRKLIFSVKSIKNAVVIKCIIGQVFKSRFIKKFDIEKLSVI